MLHTLLFILTVVQMTDCFDPDNLTEADCEILQPDAPNKFSIRVEENFTGEAGLCIRVFCSFTFPQSVSDPIRRTWFKGDPRNPTVEVPYFSTNIYFPHNERQCNFLLNHLVQGESDGEYRLKLEWGEGKVYIFSQIVNITVKELTQKPTINVPLLTAGEKAELSCKVPGDCIEPLADIVWTGIDGETSRRGHGVSTRQEFFSIMAFHLKPEHHNTKVTCTVTLQGRIRTESTVILEVRYAAKILNSSRCLVWGDELNCMCVSSGVPLPQIYWPILNTTTKYSSAVSTENNIRISNISIPGFRNVNATIECVSINLIDMTKIEIQVHNHGGKPKVSWSLSSLWIFFTLSVVLNVIFASCLTVVLRRKRHKKPKDGNHVYMTAMKKEELVYETIKMTSE